MHKSTRKARYKLAIITAVMAASSADQSATACSLPVDTQIKFIKLTDERSLIAVDGREWALASVLLPNHLDRLAYAEINRIRQPAIKFLKSHVLPRSVSLANPGLPDRFGRRFAQVILQHDDTTTWLQARLVAAGHARVLLAEALAKSLPRSCIRELLNREATAQQSAKGLWSNGAYQPLPANQPERLRRFAYAYVSVQGIIKRVDARRRYIYLNFGSNWRTDTTARLSSKTMQRFGLAAARVSALQGMPVRVRGWLSWHYGPLILIDHPYQIERLVLTGASTPSRTVPPWLLE